MNKPKLPKPPVKPTIDQVELYSESREKVFASKDYCQLTELSNIIEKYKDPIYNAYMEYKIVSDYDYYETTQLKIALNIYATIRTEYSEEEKQNQFNRLMKIYNANMKRYEKDLSSYNKRLEEYNNWLANEKQREIEELKDKKEQIEKQLNKLSSSVKSNIKDVS